MKLIQVIGIGLVLVGLLLYVISLSYQRPRAGLDVRILKASHHFLRRQPWVSVFRWLWPLGTTPAALALLLLLAILNLKLGLMTALVLVIVMSVENLIKRAHARPRPFQALHGVEMLQPRRPHDPSFPSGDALRAWFLALLLPFALGAGYPFVQGITALAASTLASLVSLGRIALGVHYPSDVIGGAGLGIIGTGIVIIMLPFRLW